jgi:hypothetical protein
MTMDSALAAGQGGTTNDETSEAHKSVQAQPTNAADLRTDDALSKSDEDLRRMAVARLAEHLDIGSSLVLRCEQLANATRGDRLGPLYAAAKLMGSNARVAQALAHVAQVETRRRSIVERIEPLGRQKGELNWGSPPPSEEDTSLDELERRLQALAKAAQPEQERLEGLAIGCCI